MSTLRHAVTAWVEHPGGDDKAIKVMIDARNFRRCETALGMTRTQMVNSFVAESWIAWDAAHRAMLTPLTWELWQEHCIGVEMGDSTPSIPQTTGTDSSAGLQSDSVASPPN
jgi:hypothetical protein